jgi:hypothetical protein
VNSSVEKKQSFQHMVVLTQLDMHVPTMDFVPYLVPCIRVNSIDK